LMILLRRRWPLGLTLVICYLLLLVPVLGILEHPHYSSDRYSIIVSILWSVLMAAWLAYPKTKTVPRRISIILTSIIIVILGFLTFQQTLIWTNSKTLFTHIIKTLGNDPYRSDIYWRLGTVYVMEGNVDEGIKYCTKAVEIEPANLNAQNALGSMLIRKNKPEEALGHFNVALLIDPSDAVVYLNKIKALLMLNRFGEAINHLDNFLQQKHDSAEGNYLLSVALEKTGKTSQAATQLKKTIMLAPNWVEPINDLAYILATSQNPSLRDPNEAIRLAKRGCELTKFQKADLLDTLAVAYASAGNFGEAVRYAEQALSLAKLSSETSLAETIQKHLYLFQQKQMRDE
jgi:tetratricopeptide (TPR) repeat protein